MTSRLQPARTVLATRTLARVALSGSLVCAATLVVLVSSQQVSSAASPDDFLCAVGNTSQTATAGNAFANPLEVEISSTSCGAPTPDTSVTNVTFALVGTPSASATFDTGAITTTSGLVSVTATANDEAGSYSVSATSPATADSSSSSVTFSLTNNDVLSDTMTADVSSYQSTNVDAPFPLALALSVDDSQGNPVSGVPVIFVAPTTGASGTFASGSTSAYVDTDANGVAVAPSFYANATAGGYAIEAYASGYAPAIAFAMTNDAQSAMTVSSVTPTVLSRGVDDVVTVSGSDFQSDADVSFSSPGVKVTSTTFVSSQELLATVTVASSARLGSSDVTVVNPSGSSATGDDVFTVAPRGVIEPLELGFSSGTVGLSGAQARRLRAFSREVGSVAIECVGYGRSATLATARTLEVVRYIRSVDPAARVTQRAVVSISSSKVTVEER